MSENGRIAKYDYRCRTGKCSRLLFRAWLPSGTIIDIRCPACGSTHEFRVPESVSGGNPEVVARKSDSG